MVGNANTPLELPEEHGDHCVPLQELERAFFQEDVCFVDEDNCAPRRRDLEYGRQIRIYRFCIRAEVRRPDDVERLCAPL